MLCEHLGMVNLTLYISFQSFAAHDISVQAFCPSLTTSPVVIYKYLNPNVFFEQLALEVCQKVLFSEDERCIPKIECCYWWI